VRRVVYACVVDEYDRLLAPTMPEADLDYIVFSDNPGVAVPAPWQLRPIQRTERNARMTARWHKLHPHLLFPVRDASLYIDSNVVLRAPVAPLFDRLLSEAPIALFRHPERDCPYAEAEVVARHRLDDEVIVEAQMAYYRAKGFPAGAGLHNTGVQFRRHADPRMPAFLEDWWRQLKVFSHRDQLSLDFMLRRHAVPCADLPGLLASSPWFALAPHRRYRVEIASKEQLAAGDELDWLRMILIEEGRRRRKPASLQAMARAALFHAMRPLRAAKRQFLILTWRPRPAAPASSRG
jgi:hypothetical protein